MRNGAGSSYHLFRVKPFDLAELEDAFPWRYVPEIVNAALSDTAVDAVLAGQSVCDVLCGGCFGENQHCGEEWAEKRTEMRVPVGICVPDSIDDFAEPGSCERRGGDVGKSSALDLCEGLEKPAAVR